MAGVKPLLETIGALLPKGIKAWHASPHDFDKVDLSKIGTGQGAQSYGPGFYAAESPAVSGVGGEYWKEFAGHFTGSGPGVDQVMSHAVELLQHHGGDRRAALKMAQEALGNQWENSPQTPRIKQVIDLLASDKQVGPRVYELNLKADPRSFLQWDEPLSQQPNITKAMPQLLDAAKEEAYNRALSATSLPRQGQLYDMVKNPEQATGEMAFRAMPGRVAGNLHSSPARGDATTAMNQMREAGIPGVRYLDQVSRQLGPANDPEAQRQIAAISNNIERLRSLGDNLKASELDQTRARLQRGLDTPRTYNYVLNNPEIIEIMRKLAIPGMLTGGAASVYQPQGQQ